MPVRKKLESIIEGIKGVIACRVVFGEGDESGEIQEVHVLATSKRSPVRMAQDVRSAILADLGTKIDKRKVSIAQVDSAKDLNKNRPILTRVALVSSDNEAEVVVDLTLGDILVSGKSVGVPTPNRWLWLAAQAALDALCKLLPSRVDISLNDVSVSQSKSARVMIVALTLTESGRATVLTGFCPIIYDERESVVKAILDAVNRKFPMLLDN